MAVEEYLPARRRQKVREQVEAGGLAGAVRADQRVNRPARDREIDIVDGDEALEFLGEAARFALPGVNVGIFCSTPAVGVARNVARKRVMEMLVTGEPIDARTALEWGLVNRVVPAADLDRAVTYFTDRIVARSASVIALGKRAFYAQIDRTAGDAYSVTSEAMACNMADPDAAEGIDAFLEKRAARWGGRR